MTALALPSVRSPRTTPASTRSWEEQTSPSGQGVEHLYFFTSGASSEPRNNTIIPVNETSAGVSVVVMGGTSRATVNLWQGASQGCWASIGATANLWQGCWASIGAIANLWQEVGPDNCHSPVYQALAGEVVASASTAVQMLSTPIDELVAELEELRELPEGWDGEGAAAPISDAIDDAMSFVRSVGDRASRLAPTPDVDGSILLEIDDGGAGSFRFRGDGAIIHAIRGVAPGIVRFDGRTVPQEISEALEAAL